MNKEFCLLGPYDGFFIQEYLVSAYYVSGTMLGTGIKSKQGDSS